MAINVKFSTLRKLLEILTSFRSENDTDEFLVGESGYEYCWNTILSSAVLQSPGLSSNV